MSSMENYNITNKSVFQSSERNDNVHDGKCIHSKYKSIINQWTVLLLVPMRVINRPFPPDLDNNKVEQFMKDIQVSESFLAKT